jgi:hypothetical protein
MRVKYILTLFGFVIAFILITSCATQRSLEYKILKEAFPSGVLTTDKNRSNLVLISIKDIEKKIAGILPEEDIQSLVEILKQTESEERDIFLRHLASMDKGDMELLLKNTDIGQDNLIQRTSIDDYRLYSLNEKIASFLYENNKIPEFYYEDQEGERTAQKVISGMVFYNDDGEIKRDYFTNYYDNRFFVSIYSRYRENPYETVGGVVSRNFTSPIAHEFKLQGTELVQMDIPNVDRRQFEKASIAFRYRFMIANSRLFEELELTDIKKISGMFYYMDKNNEIKSFPSKSGFYQDSKGNYYLNGHKQALYNGQLIPQQFLDIADDGGKLFSYANMWINVKPVHVEDAYYINPVKTIYVSDKDGNLWYFQDGGYLSAKDLEVQPEYAQKIEELNDWYIEQRKKNLIKTIEDFDENITNCRYLMRQWRDAKDKEDEELQVSLLKEIDNILNSLKQLK